MLVTLYKTLIAIVFSVISIYAPFLSNVAQRDFVPLDAEKVNLTFATISDTHMNENESRLFLLKLGLSDMHNAKHPLDAFVLSGDITHHAYEEHWSMLKKGFDSYSPAENIILSIGNHDTWGGDYGVRVGLSHERFFRYSKEIANRDISKVYYSTKINGYTFIVLGSEDDGENAYISETQLAWLGSELEKAAADNLPIFVVLHQPINLTHGLPDTWGIGEPTEFKGGIGVQSAQVEALLQQYKNIFYISGHIHNSVTNAQTSLLYGYESVETYGNITSVNLPAYSLTRSHLETGKGLGFVFEAYDDEVVIRTRSFTNSIWIPQYTYTVPLT